MRFPRLFRTNFFNRVDYFKSIEELPIWHWNKVHESKNINYLRKDGNLEATPRQELVDAWEFICDEYIDKFGINKEYEIYLNSDKRATLLELQAAIYGDKKKLTFAEIERRKAEEFKPKEKSGSFNESMAILTKDLGFRVDPKVMTVLEFYTHIKLLNEASKRAKQESKKRKNARG